MEKLKDKLVIARFMNRQIFGDGEFTSYEIGMSDGKRYLSDAYEDYNDIMSIVDKIESLKTPITNNPNLIGEFETYEIEIFCNVVNVFAHGEVTKDICQIKKPTKKLSVYEACLEFINWYNQRYNNI